MLFFVYGSESYLVREKCRQIETRLRQDKGSLSCEHLDSCDLQQLQSKAASLSMFGEHLCLRLDGVIKSGKIDGDAGIQFLESIGTTVSIIFIEAEPDRRGKLVKYLMKHAEVHACQPLEGEELNAWIMRTAEDRGGAFDRTAAGLLAQTAGSDLWKLSQEIDKLLAYTGGQAITAEAIQAITIPVCEEDIFPFIDAIAEGKNARAVQLLHQNLQAGMHALALFRMIVRQFRLLIYARAKLDARQTDPGELARDMHIHPYPARKTYAQAQRFTSRQLITLYDTLAGLDLDMKNGRVDPELGLDLFTLRLGLKKNQS